MSVVIMLFGQQAQQVEQGVAQLVRQYPDITVLQAESGHEPGDIRLPRVFHLAWLFVNEADIGLPAVSRWCGHLAATAPVTVASFGTHGEPPAAPTGNTLPSGTFMQSFTADTAQQVFQVIAAFLSRAARVNESVRASRSPA